MKRQPRRLVRSPRYTADEWDELVAEANTDALAQVEERSEQKEER